MFYGYFSPRFYVFWRAFVEWLWFFLCVAHFENDFLFCIESIDNINLDCDFASVYVFFFHSHMWWWWICILYVLYECELWMSLICNGSFNNEILLVQWPDFQANPRFSLLYDMINHHMERMRELEKWIEQKNNVILFMIIALTLTSEFNFRFRPTENVSFNFVHVAVGFSNR